MLRNMAYFIDSSFVKYAIIITIIYLLGVLIIRLVNREVENLRKRHNARKVTLYSTVLCILIFTIFFWLESVKSVAMVISIVGAGLVVALQDTIVCFAGWILIIFKRPFTVGDRVQIGEIKGDVIDVRMFQTALLEVGNWVAADQSTGRVVHVPNSSVFREKVFNYTKGFEFVWNEIRITVTFESNWRRARDIILSHANPEIDKLEARVKSSIKRMAQEYMIYYEKFTPIVYVNIADYGVELTLRYLTEVRDRRSTQDRISRNILDDFAAEKEINFAYPTYRIVKK